METPAISPGLANRFKADLAPIIGPSGLRTPVSIWLAFLLGFIALCLPSEAAAQRHLEDAVKATFLSRFGSFVEWPPSAFATPDSPFIICLTGSSAFAALVEESTVGSRVRGRSVVVSRLNAVTPRGGCHILYLAAGQTTASALQTVRGQATLTITDARYGESRGVIHFVVSGGRVRFHIDRDQERRQGIALSSRLLDLALTVQDRNR